MSVEHKVVGKNRYRESFGRYLEDFTVGDVYEHRPGRTISETDNTWFTLLTMNTHPLHFDAEYAAKSEFGKPLVNSCLTLSIVAGMSVSDLSQKAIGNLGWDKIKLSAPVFAGDTIYAMSEVLGKRESKPPATRPTARCSSATSAASWCPSAGTVSMTRPTTEQSQRQHHGITNEPTDNERRRQLRRIADPRRH